MGCTARALPSSSLSDDDNEGDNKSKSEVLDMNQAEVSV